MNNQQLINMDDVENQIKDLLNIAEALRQQVRRLEHAELSAETQLVEWELNHAEWVVR